MPTHPFCRCFEFCVAKTEGRFLYCLGDDQWTIPGLKERLEDVPIKRVCFQDFEVGQHSYELRSRTRIFNASPLEATHKNGPFIRLTANDASGREQAEKALEAAHAEIRKRTAEVNRLSGQLLHAQHEERRCLAHELHDRAGQILAALSMNLTPLQFEGGKVSRRSRKAVKESLALIDQLSRELRTISHLLHPPLLEEVGLSSALRMYLEGFTQRSKIKVDFNLPQEFGRLTPDLEITLFV